MKPESKKCGESCGCVNSQDLKKDDQKNLAAQSTEHESKKNPAATNEVKTEEKKLDPTHFGDWQINGRAIDF